MIDIIMGNDVRHCVDNAAPPSEKSRFIMLFPWTYFSGYFSVANLHKNPKMQHV